MKILEENIDSKILDTACSNTLSDFSPHSRETKENNKQMGLHQTNNLLHTKTKETINKIKKKNMEWETYFLIHLKRG